MSGVLASTTWRDTTVFTLTQKQRISKMKAQKENIQFAVKLFFYTELKNRSHILATLDVIFVMKLTMV
jgi:hypothetical protein